VRIPLLSGSRLVVANVPDDATVLRPPLPGETVADVVGAVRDALRFPLEGEPAEALVAPRARATIVIEPPMWPLSSAVGDPRQQAVAAVVEELERLGVQTGYQTILVAGGLGRRLGQRELTGLVPPDLARRFHGRVIVHDVEDPDLVEIATLEGEPLRLNRALVDTDVVFAVTAAETVVDGGPAALLKASGRETLRTAGAASLLETAGSSGWECALALERALARRVPIAGASILLNQPVLGGAARGYPHDVQALERIATSPLRWPFAVLPGALRAQLLRSVPIELTAAAAFGGPPSVAHAEALLRAVELRCAELDRPLDAIVLGIPPLSPQRPRETPNPLLAGYLGLGLALRLWRDNFPVHDDGTVVLLDRFARHFSPTQQPYRAFFNATRVNREPGTVLAAERAAVADARAIELYRAGRTTHPLLPFRHWADCEPALERLGAVLVAGCRDAAAARQLGFVPVHGLGAALEMARGRAGESARIGFLVAPPYFPLRVSKDR
jgi:Lactate racemase N-terminal domain